jgi:hypothetical protein
MVDIEAAHPGLVQRKLGRLQLAALIKRRLEDPPRRRSPSATARIAAYRIRGQLNPDGAFVMPLIVFFSVSPVERTFNTAVLVCFAPAVSGGATAVSFGNSFGIQPWLRLPLGAFLGVDEFVVILSRILGAGFQYMTKFDTIVAIILLLPLFVLLAAGGLLAVKRG